MIGDFDTYGPRGSGDFDFKLIGAIPMKYIKGNLIESWEVDQDKITWKVKQGIYWAPTEAQSAWMDAREFTAEDLAADLRHWATGPEGARLLANKDANIYADGDNVIIEFAEFDFILNATLGLSRPGFVGPPEMLEDGASPAGRIRSVPARSCSPSTFPTSSSAWSRTPTTAARPWSTAKSTSCRSWMSSSSRWPTTSRTRKRRCALASPMAAPRSTPPTGTRWTGTAPDLIQDRLPISFGGTFAFNTSKPPFDNRDVRRALLVGTNLDDFAAQRGAKGVDLPEHWWPIYPSLASYTPQSELPPEAAMLYEYDPEKAEADARRRGYPDGFTVNFYTGNWTTVLQGRDHEGSVGQARGGVQHRGQRRRRPQPARPGTRLRHDPHGLRLRQPGARHAQQLGVVGQPESVRVQGSEVRRVRARHAGGDGRGQARHDHQGSRGLPPQRGARHSARREGDLAGVVAVGQELLR